MQTQVTTPSPFYQGQCTRLGRKCISYYFGSQLDAELFQGTSGGWILETTQGCVWAVNVWIA